MFLVLHAGPANGFHGNIAGVIVAPTKHKVKKRSAQYKVRLLHPAKRL